MEEKKVIYVVKGAYGSYGDYTEFSLFATFDKQYAERYKAKYNRILDLASDFYETKVIDYDGNEDNIIHFDRYMEIIDLNYATIEEIEVR